MIGGDDILKVCSLFSGMGGIDLAFKQVGFEIIFACEMDYDACDTYRLNFPKTCLFEGDIRAVDVRDVPQPDIIVAGFPCQPFSICGKRQGFLDERGNLFFEILRFVDILRPSVVFLENVANLVRHDSGNTFQTILSEFSKRGYCVKYKVVDACEYGLPQHRTRIYIVAARNEKVLDVFTFPKTTGISLKIKDVVIREEKVDERYYFQIGGPRYGRLSRFIDDEEQLYRFSDYGIQKSVGGISFTLKANMGTWHDRVPIVKDDFGIRRITPRECLRLQGFPENFKIDGMVEKALYKQIGNSVCVPVVEAIASNIMAAMVNQ